jgi:RNA polymerase sigma factor (sigma-70 family)
MNPEIVQDALERFESPLIEFTRRITGDVESARDVVQDVFLKLWRVDPMNEPAVAAHLAEWLYTVCRHRALDHMRKETAMKTRDLRVGERHGAAGETPPLTAVESRDDFRTVMRWLEKLPPKQAEAVRLKFQGQLSYPEIARVMGESLGNVGWLIHQGIKTLRERVAVKEARS